MISTEAFKRKATWWRKCVIQGTGTYYFQLRRDARRPDFVRLWPEWLVIHVEHHTRSYPRDKQTGRFEKALDGFMIGEPRKAQIDRMARYFHAMGVRPLGTKPARPTKFKWQGKGLLHSSIPDTASMLDCWNLCDYELLAAYGPVRSWWRIAEASLLQ